MPARRGLEIRTFELSNDLKSVGELPLAVEDLCLGKEKNLPCCGRGLLGKRAIDQGDRLFVLTEGSIDIHEVTVDTLGRSLGLKLVDILEKRFFGFRILAKAPEGVCSLISGISLPVCSGKRSGYCPIAVESGLIVLVKKVNACELVLRLRCVAGSCGESAIRVQTPPAN